MGVCRRRKEVAVNEEAEHRDEGQTRDRDGSFFVDGGRHDGSWRSVSRIRPVRGYVETDEAMQMVLILGEYFGWCRLHSEAGAGMEDEGASQNDKRVSSKTIMRAEMITLKPRVGFGNKVRPRLT
jgi:hypothetical protein